MNTLRVRRDARLAFFHAPFVKMGSSSVGLCPVFVTTHCLSLSIVRLDKLDRWLDVVVDDTVATDVRKLI